MAIDVSLFGDDDLHVPAWKFFCDPARFKLARTGRRGAKTYTAAKSFLDRIFNLDWPRWKDAPYNPGVRPGSAAWWTRRARLHYWICAAEYELLAEPKKYLMQFIPPELFDHMDNGKGVWWLKGDILIEFKTLRDPTKKVGSGLNGMWIEEAARVRQDAWPLYLRPALSDKQGWCIFTTTPLGMDWTYEHVEKHAEAGRPGFSVHTWKTVENTRCEGLAEEVAEARATLAPEYFEREYEASRRAFIGQIYKGFKRETCVVSKLPPNIQFQKTVGGCDWGTHGALTVCGMTPGDKPHYWFLDEDCADNLLVEDYWVPKAIKFQQTWRFWDWVADPAEPDNLTRFRNAGIRVSKHRNYGAGQFDEHARSVLSGIRTMSSALHQGRVHVLVSCKNLIEEFENYVWDMNPAGQQLQGPKPHQKDHAVTTARYIISSVEKGPMMKALGVAA